MAVIDNEIRSQIAYTRAAITRTVAVSIRISVTSKPATIGTFDMGTSQVPRHQQIVTIETEAELCCGNPARWSG